MYLLIDSEALNISLVSSEVLKYLSCNTKLINCTLKGIGYNKVVAESCVALTVEFSDITFEADFVIVPAETMITPWVRTS